MLDATGTCERVFNFMGLEGCDVQSAESRPRPRSHADGFEVATILRAHYRPYDELLTEVVGQRFSWMPNSIAAAA